MDWTLISTEPASIVVGGHKVSEHQVNFEFPLLNPGDSVQLQFTCGGCPANSINPTVYARVVGIPEIDVIHWRDFLSDPQLSPREKGKLEMSVLILSSFGVPVVPYIAIKYWLDLQKRPLALIALLIVYTVFLVGWARAIVRVYRYRSLLRFRG